MSGDVPKDQGRFFQRKAVKPHPSDPESRPLPAARRSPNEGGHNGDSNMVSSVMAHVHGQTRTTATSVVEATRPSSAKVRTRMGWGTAQVKEGPNTGEIKKGRGNRLLYERAQGIQKQFQKGEDGLQKGRMVIKTLDHAWVQKGQVPKRGWLGGAVLVCHIYQWREGSSMRRRGSHHRGHQ